MTLPDALFDAVDEILADLQTTRFAPGEEPAPGSAAVTDNAVGESTEPISGGLGAGAGVPVVRARDDGRAVGADGAATFSLPNTRVPLVWPGPQAGDNPGPSMPPGVPPPPPTGPGPGVPPPLGVGPLYDALPQRS